MSLSPHNRCSLTTVTISTAKAAACAAATLEYTMQERLRKAHARIEELSAALMNEIRRAEAMKVPTVRRVRRVASLGPVLRAVLCVCENP